ncbi:MAG: dephospho-CoA kinase, partial [Candidatus Omnitrophica bacterium]|nr:dephospho-CoA kinase [Candidatus Omnitrophota bacterium]
KDILDKKGRIDRARLSDAAFKEASSIKRLSNIIHPSVIKQIKQIIRKAHTCEKPKIVIIDAPLLIEARLHNICDIVIVVKTSRATQIRRIKKKMRISTEQIMARIKNQLPLKNKIRYADYVIDNSGPEVDTNKSVNALYDKIKKSAT